MQRKDPHRLVAWLLVALKRLVGSHEISKQDVAATRSKNFRVVIK